MNPSLFIPIIFRQFPTVFSRTDADLQPTQRSPPSFTPPPDTSPRRPSRTPVHATLRLTNLSTSRVAVFKVRTNRADWFTVKPVHGVVPPNGACEIVVSLVAAAAHELAAIDPRTLPQRDLERFLIQSVEQADDMRGFDVDDLAAFWRRVPRELPSASRVGCRFAVLPHSPADAHVLATAQRMDAFAKLLEARCEEHDNQDASGGSGMPPMLQRFTNDPPSSPRGIDRTIDVRHAHTSGEHTDTAQDEPDDAFAAHQDAASSELPLSPPRRPAALFQIHPGDTLEFTVRPARPGRPAVLEAAAFFLSNASRTHALAFKIKTTNHEGYFVLPSRGLIGPSNAQRIEVQPVKDDRASVNTTLDLQQREASDRFLVEIARVPIADYQELLSLDERARKRELAALWTRSTPGAREKALLNCRIVGAVPPPEAPELKPESPPSLAPQDVEAHLDEPSPWC
ncbi:hypothetical protein PybrP1_007747 [[Pythium] brassicae (nom. inval.)]|nr:hypothetical protein PybrP1_007747 [[Pythium] brassicae (nom. inval.)]